MDWNSHEGIKRGVVLSRMVVRSSSKCLLLRSARPACYRSEAHRRRELRTSHYLASRSLVALKPDDASQEMLTILVRSITTVDQNVESRH
jgi:hypothetical protein